MYLIIKLTKLISRKNLYQFIQQEIDFIITQKKNIRVLNIGSGGDIERFIKRNKNVKLISMDISRKRKPDVVYDISKNDVQDKIKFKPDVVIKRRNGWLESIFVNFIRLYFERNYFSKLLGLGFTILYFISYPLIIILQKIFISDKLTTGYFIKATK